MQQSAFWLKITAKPLLLSLLLSLSLLTTACNNTQRVREPTPTPTTQPTGPQISVIAEGLLGPIGLVAMPNGALLVAEEAPATATTAPVSV